METLVDKALSVIPILVAVAIGSGIGAFYFFRYITELAKLSSDMEQQVRDRQDSDRDALVDTLTKELSDRKITIDNLLAINKSLHKRLGIFSDIDGLDNNSGISNQEESNQNT